MLALFCPLFIRNNAIPHLTHPCICMYLTNMWTNNQCFRIHLSCSKGNCMMQLHSMHDQHVVVIESNRLSLSNTLFLNMQLFLIFQQHHTIETHHALHATLSMCLLLTLICWSKCLWFVYKAKLIPTHWFTTSHTSCNFGQLKNTWSSFSTSKLQNTQFKLSTSIENIFLFLRFSLVGNLPWSILHTKYSDLLGIFNFHNSTNSSNSFVAFVNGWIFK